MSAARAFALAAALLLSLYAVVDTLPAAANALTVTVADSFDTETYSGNLGTTQWSTPWREIGENDGPDDGDVRVAKTGNCPSAPCVEIKADDDTPDLGLFRSADFAGASLLELSYTLVQKEGEGAGVLRVRVSSDGGSTWSTVAAYNNSTRTTSASVDISTFASGATTVAFVADGAMDHTAWIDDVTVTAIFAPTGGAGQTSLSPDVSLTTTSSKPPLTVTSLTIPPTSSTTTTTPPPTTTTTTRPPTTTTTRPPTTTTTTRPLTTTTTTSSATTSTTAAPPGEPPEDGAVGSDEPGSSGDGAGAAAGSPPGTGTGTEARPSVEERRSVDVQALSQELTADTEVEPTPDGRQPLTRLGAVLTTSAATLRSQLAPAIVLGVVLAWAALAGLGGRRLTRRRPDILPPGDDTT